MLLWGSARYLLVHPHHFWRIWQPSYLKPYRPQPRLFCWFACVANACKCQCYSFFSCFARHFWGSRITKSQWMWLVLGAFNRQGCPDQPFQVGLQNWWLANQEHSEPKPQLLLDVHLMLTISSTRCCQIEDIVFLDWSFYHILPGRYLMFPTPLEVSWSSQHIIGLESIQWHQNVSPGLLWMSNH